MLTSCAHTQSKTVGTSQTFVSEFGRFALKGLLRLKKDGAEEQGGSERPGHGSL